MPRLAKGSLIYSLRLVLVFNLTFKNYVLDDIFLLARKIPIEHILAATRGNAARPGGSEGSRPPGGVNLGENTAKPDACNC